MATQLALSAQPSTTSLLERKVAEAKIALTQPTTPATSALKAAKQLVGSFPHARPPEPETYAGAIGATLAQYPPAVVADCADPRIGLARKLRFPPTVAEIVEWCDARMAYYESLARYQAREVRPEREFTDADRVLARKFLAALAAELKDRNVRASLTATERNEARMRNAERLGRHADKLAAREAAQ